MKTSQSAFYALVLIAIGIVLGAGASSQWQQNGQAQPVTQPIRNSAVPVAQTPPVKQMAPPSGHAARGKSTFRPTPVSSPIALPPTRFHAPALVSLKPQLPIAFNAVPVRVSALEATAEQGGAQEKEPTLSRTATTTFSTDPPMLLGLPALSSLPFAGASAPIVTAPESTPRMLRLAQAEIAIPAPTPAAPETTTAAPPATVKPATPVAAEPPVVRSEVFGGQLDKGEMELLFADRPIINETLTVERAVEIALKESPMIRGATAEVEAAQGRLAAARSEGRPMVSANLFAAKSTIPTIIESPQTVQPSMIMSLPEGRFIDGNLMVMYPLFTSGRIKAMTQQAAALRNASQSELEAQRQEVALLTRIAFREAQARRALVEVQESRLRENEEQLRIDRVRAEEGKIPAFFVLRSEAEVAQTNQELTNARRDVELSLVQLQTVMGVNPASQIEIKEALTYEPSPAANSQLVQADVSDVNALLRLAQRQRPELQASQQRIIATQAESSSIRAEYRPQINAFGSADAMKMQGERRTTGTSFGVVASMSIFNGGQKKARVATAEAERQREEAQRQRVLLQVGQEVQTSVLNLRASEQNITTAQAALRSAQEDYRLARVRYEAGRSTLVEVLDALATRVRAESNLVQALFEYNTSRDQLLRAVGTI